MKNFGPSLICLGAVFAAGYAATKSDHWLLDSWKITGGGDSRLTALVVVYSSAADYRESSRRRMDRDHGGRDR